MGRRLRRICINTYIGEQPHYRRLPFGVVYGLAGGLEWLYRSFGLVGEPPLTRYTVCTLGYAQTMDIRPAREILGYQPEKTLTESIQEYGAWWKENHRMGEAGSGKTHCDEQSGGSARSDMSKEARSGKESGSLVRSDGVEKAESHAKPSAPARPSKVMEVKLYRCGSCTNNLGIMFRGVGWKKREFPARVALIRHKEFGNILYDTGYSEEIFRGGLWLWLYRLLNPVQLEKEETISVRLKKDGIPPESVKNILLSHAHPDHVGGLSEFSGYELIALKETLDALCRPRIRNLMFPNLVPSQGCIGRQRQPEGRLKDHFLCRYFEEVYDLFGDGSIIAHVSM